MLVKNAAIFQFSGITLESLEEALGHSGFVPCLPSAAGSRGFVPPIEGECALTRIVEKVALFAMREDEKILPACVVNAEHKLRIQDVATKQRRRVGRKEAREIKNVVPEELRAKAFIRTTVTHAWLDFGCGLLVVDSISDARIVSLVGLLARMFAEAPVIRRWNTNGSPVAHFTDWVQSAEAPPGFSIDDSALLTHPEGGRVRLTGLDVLANDVRPLLENGRTCVELALMHDEKVSFVVNQHLRIKRMTHLGIAAQRDPSQLDLLEADRCDAEITLSAGAIRNLFSAFNRELEGMAAADIEPPSARSDEAWSDRTHDSEDPLYAEA